MATDGFARMLCSYGLWGYRVDLSNILLNSPLSYTLQFQVNQPLKLRMRREAIAHFLKAAAD
ncbi:MAG: hypothetical protein HC840_21580 [Leptolyngbyaceae cyanobacterium RM2_2_4]|nr:hypothetical protein [Leptolyngbyaceae cyanobacterium SM1_4_3]NJN90642.1 hypothetical protein [Leptolyngbyaceae cyanobacterium SL_5_14]NJO51581.1 hypothetical protein [Leptolyngbyaceae cyanobacterium RM2_2_4]